MEELNYRTHIKSNKVPRMDDHMAQHCIIYYDCNLVHPETLQLRRRWKKLTSNSKICVTDNIEIVLQ